MCATAPAQPIAAALGQRKPVIESGTVETRNRYDRLILYPNDEYVRLPQS